MNSYKKCMKFGPSKNYKNSGKMFAGGPIESKKKEIIKEKKEFIYNGKTYFI